MGREGRRTAVTRYSWTRSPRSSRTTTSSSCAGRGPAAPEARASARRVLVTKRQVLSRYALAALGAALGRPWRSTSARRPRPRLVRLAARRRVRRRARAVTWGELRAELAAVRPVVNGTGVDEPVVAITFDDGPSPDTTPRVLDALRDAGAVATFFVLGKHAEQHPEIVEPIVREGHEVASTATTTASSRSPARREHAPAARTERLLQSLGVPAGPPVPRTARLPQPVVGADARDALGYRVVGWTKGVFDTAKPGAGDHRALAASARCGRAPSCSCTTPTARATATAARRRTPCRRSSPASARPACGR